MKKLIKTLGALSAAGIIALSALPLSSCNKSSDVLTLKVSNWEEYIDLGDWDEEELIDIDNPFNPDLGGVFGENSMVSDFTDWFNATHDYEIAVEYSTFGTNEDLYNRLNLGDVYDLVCPSEYLIMKLLAEDKLEKYSSQFFDESIESNYYTKNVSPHISNTFAENGWRDYAACYMWGTTGIVYNPEVAEIDDVSSWNILKNCDYARKVTVKDNVRDAYFAALGILNDDTLLSDDVTPELRKSLLNSTDDETIESAQNILKEIKNNVYSFETDSGKADMITGKVAANFQWSGDGVFIMDEAEADEEHPTELWYSVPRECTNLWFDGWVMLKDGIKSDPRKKEAAEAFVNFLSRPDNAVRNMYYIGYTSSSASDMTLDYLCWNYEADEETEDIFEYDLSYFFGDDVKIMADASCFIIDENGEANYGRQLFAQYPPQNVIDRSVVMLDFGERLSDINHMWINVRCLDVKDFNPAVVWTIIGIIVAGAAAIVLYKFRYRIL